MPDSPVAVAIDYTNHRGERRERVVVPLTIVFKKSEWHGSKPQWILEAYDYGKDAYRDFAMKDVHSWRPAAYTPNKEKTDV